MSAAAVLVLSGIASARAKYATQREVPELDRAGIVRKRIIGASPRNAFGSV